MQRSGVIPSPPDERDYGLCMAMEVADIDIPDVFEVWQPPVENQGQTGNCVAQTLANIMECIDHHDGLEHRDRSVGYIYGTQKSYGMWPREACAALVKDGDVYRAAWEYLDDNPDCWLMRQAVSQAVKDTAKKVLMYVRISSEEELKLFMMKYNLPVMITADAVHFGGLNGSHAVACRGWRTPGKFQYDQRNLHFTNSWGATWGDDGNGTGWIKFDNTNEIWGIVPMEKVKFEDVAEGRWSKEAIRIVVEDGVLKGYPDNTFRPTAPMTREEYAVAYSRQKHALQMMVKSMIESMLGK